MSTSKVLTEFRGTGRVLVSEQDYDALKGYAWRLDAYGYAVRSVGKRNIRLAREVADRAGMAPGQVRFHSDDPLDCTRANLVIYAGGTGPRARRNPGPLQPHAVHRHAMTQDGHDGPPPGWVFRWHPGPCSYDGKGQLCLRPAEYIGSALRLTTDRGYPGGWEFTGPRGQYRPPSFYEGCRFLRTGFWLSLIPQQQPVSPAGLALWGAMCGEERPA